MNYPHNGDEALTDSRSPKQQYEVRRAERAKLKGMDEATKSRTEQVMLLDTLDRFVTAVERIADAMEESK